MKCLQQVGEFLRLQIVGKFAKTPRKRRARFSLLTPTARLTSTSQLQEAALPAAERGTDLELGWQRRGPTRRAERGRLPRALDSSRRAATPPRAPSPRRGYPPPSRPPPQERRLAAVSASARPRRPRMPPRRARLTRGVVGGSERSAAGREAAGTTDGPREAGHSCGAPGGGADGLGPGPVPWLHGRSLGPQWRRRSSCGPGSATLPRGPRHLWRLCRRRPPCAAQTRASPRALPGRLPRPLGGTSPRGGPAAGGR
mmetsp:Transcript_27754/g.65947  ORF Transcript_27754/g.65947 Transcript_27754/m.65947 type:complete len:256 (+) Transcript_27754:112-879(+)